LLIPDFAGSAKSLEMVIDSGPQVINHNMETVLRLYPHVRIGADYHRSLALLRRARQIAGSTVMTKSGIMVGLGEHPHEVIDLLRELRVVGCDSLTIGQYLSPSANHYELVEYITPEKFAEYRDLANALGFEAVASSPLVRSSYDAAAMYARWRSSRRDHQV
jgi:lipoic acid synthetase